MLTVPLISNFTLVKEKYNGHSSHGNKQHYFGKFWQSFGTVVKEIYNKHISHDNELFKGGVEPMNQSQQQQHDNIIIPVELLANMPILRRHRFDVVVECGDGVWCVGW